MLSFLCLCVCARAWEHACLHGRAHEHAYCCLHMKNWKLKDGQRHRELGEERNRKRKTRSMRQREQHLERGDLTSPYPPEKRVRKSLRRKKHHRPCFADYQKGYDPLRKKKKSSLRLRLPWKPCSYFMQRAGLFAVNKQMPLETVRYLSGAASTRSPSQGWSANIIWGLDVSKQVALYLNVGVTTVTNKKYFFRFLFAS